MARFIAHRGEYRAEVAAAAQLLLGRATLGISDKRVSRGQLRLSASPNGSQLTAANVGVNSIGIRRAASAEIAPLRKGASTSLTAADLPATVYLSQASALPLLSLSLSVSLYR